MNNYHRKYFIRRNPKKCGYLCKIVLKNGKSCVIIDLPNIANKQYCLQTNTLTCVKVHKKDRRKCAKMVNIKDAANYVIGLFYNNDLSCTSAVIQKILVISQMRYLRLYDSPLFNEQIIVKPACFSIDFVSKFYPINIFEEAMTSYEETLPDKIFPDKNINIDIDSKSQLSSYTYKIECPLSEQQKNVLGETFSCFYKYTGVAIGNAMQKMELHKEYISSSKSCIDVEEQQEYVRKIVSNPFESDNAIINFILSN